MKKLFFILFVLAICVAMIDLILTNLANGAYAGAQWVIANTINSTGPAIWATVMFIISSMVLNHGHLATFEKPTHPRLSNLVRVLATKFYPGFWLAGLVVLVLAAAGMIGYVVAYGMHPKFSGIPAHTLFWHALGSYWSATSTTHTAQLSGIAVGVLYSMAFSLFLIPTIIRSGLGPKTQSILDALKRIQQFNPQEHIDINKGLFIGVDTKQRPIYVPWRKVDETHMQIMGSTGAGKGVSLSLMGKQFISKGKSLVIFDPKGDTHAKSIWIEAAKKEQREFIFLDLNRPIPQINPFASTTSEESADLLIAAFELRSQGSDGDYYKGREEDCCYILSDLGADSLPTIIQNAHQDPVVQEEENFLRKLRKLERSKVFMTQAGPNLQQAIQSGAVLYIQCSAGSEAVTMAQKLLLLRIMQIIKARQDKKRSVAIILDEFKYMLSPAALTALGLMRSSNCHCLLAFQAIGDLLDNPMLNAESAKSAVLTNTALKLIFRIPEISYAEELSKMTLTHTRFDEITGKKPDELSKQGAGSWREVQEPNIPANLLTNLPMPTDHKDGKTISCGVLFTGSHATPFVTCPVIHNNSQTDITHATPVSVEIKKGEDLI